MINRIKEVNRMAATSAQQQILPTDFSQIRVGIRALEDAVLDNVGTLKRANPRYGNKDFVSDAINKNDVASLREISNFFYKTSGIYNRICRYFAYLYRYDWMITPVINNGKNFTSQEEIKRAEKDKVLNNFFEILRYLDAFEVKQFFGDVALKVVRDGCYYGYLIRQNGETASIQELPIKYCRSRFSVNRHPAVEFNMKYFDDMYSDSEQRAKILKLFPLEFKKGYEAYKKGRLIPDFKGDTAGWYLLDIENAIKFSVNSDDTPLFIPAVLGVIDLDEAQEMDKRKVAQKLLRILIQKMPLDKNGDPVFSVEEARELHNNAVTMLSRSIGVDILTTFADVDVADMSDKSNSSQTDDIQRVERAVYNDFGVSQMNFNSSSNTALNNSILNDESSLASLIRQFESFLNFLLKPYNKNPKKCLFKAQVLFTTIYNYKDLAKIYKEQTQLGYSKMLPQVALGQSQSSILANAYFENDILNLVTKFIPPLSSHTMNSTDLLEQEENKESGRPELEDNEKSEKTLANRESL